MPAEGTKVCKHCGRLLSTSMFYRHRTSKDGFWSTCKECCREERRTLKEQQRAGIKPEQQIVFSISNLTDDAIFDELRRRGYIGELKYYKVVNI
ncbi:hypothetical protein [Phocaeicola dorei]|jgi:hypothetical protein|uniref:hypothetical protein n=1 Tax=Phocaeicola dorei TaxID=357276 RepID=UPI001BDE9974|nr:hypothetical protein [Phocaeicola dorei]MBT1285881.1 hypothetical protein [Phocaeicola dorei]MBT1289749.1 hypothetical protein [Phocaeicola dorei]